MQRAVGRRTFLAASVAAVAAGCAGLGTAKRVAAPVVPPPPAPTPSPALSGAGSAPPHSALPPTTDPKVIASRATVPVLCWHQLRDWKPGDTAYNKRFLLCPPADFTTQLDAIKAAGYTTISPDQYLAHLTTGAALPDKPVLLSFDDSQGSQVSVGLPELAKRQMTATFFIMTVVLGKTGWMTTDDLRRLDGAGMTVAAHTYDHHRVDRYTAKDWAVQLDQPRTLLESVLGKPVPHFAYPYGAWNAGDFSHVTSAGYRSAYQLSDKPVDGADPLFTLRRVLMTSTWTGPELLAALAAAP